MKLKEARQKAMLSQRELAIKAGVTHVTISRLESGKSIKPNFETRRKLSNVLGIDSIDWWGEFDENETRIKS